MMKNNKRLNFPINFLELINGKSVLFQYEENTRIPEILDSIVSDIHSYFCFPEIHLRAENNTVMQELSTDATIIIISRNLTSTMMKLEKLIFRNKHVIITDNIEEIITFPESTSRILFLDTLLCKNKDNHGILLSSYRQKSFDDIFEKKIVEKYDIVINIDKDKLAIRNMDEAEPMYYTISNTGITISSVSTSDTDKIKELFQLTPEEREELDRIVGEQIKDFDIS